MKRTWLLAAATFLTVAIPDGAVCQSTSAPATATFEAVSVKPSLEGAQGLRGMVQIGVIANNVTVKQLIRYAFELQDPQIVGPAWINTERYNITAQPKGSATTAQLRLMLQKLLEEHFKLKTHREMKQLPVYWLLIAEGGPKLRDAEHEHVFNAAAAEKSPFKPGFNAIFKADVVSGFAERVSRAIGRPVLDQTGLKGRFWFQLEWVPDNSQPASPAPLIAAMPEQLGLKLEEKSEPSEVLVVDAVQKP